MELRHLRVFMAVSDELHFGRAAERLHVAQSAVSQTIKDLETELGVTLLRRTKRKVELTEAGREMLASSEAALATLEAGSAAAKRAASGATGRLTLHAVMSSTLTRLSSALARQAALHPGVELRLVFGTNDENLDALRRGACDVALVSLATQSAAPFHTAIIEESRVALLVSRKHPLAGRRHLRLAEIGSEKLILLKESGNPSVRRHLREKLERAGVRPKVVLEVDQLEAMLSLVDAGLGVAIAPQYVSRATDDRIRAVPLDPPAFGGIKAIWNASDPSPIVARFVKLLVPTRTDEVA